MSDYNGFKIKRPHSLAPLTSVYEAEAVDGRPGRFALKIFHPPASTNVRRFYAIEGWLLAAERQQQAAQKDGTVLPVLACGRCAEGAFTVLPWQERFLEPWIKALGAKGNTLRALAECLFSTIEKWEKETGGPHGNLKPANIFPDRTGPLIGMTMTLSDPAYLPGANPEALRQADLAAVGTILATIVRRRAPGAWPIEEAPEWKALGNGGKGWLDFCNYLLNPQPGEGEVTLAKARLRLKKVPKDANPVKMAMLSMAAVLVISGISLVGFARFGNPVYMPDQIERLAIKLGNPQTLRSLITPEWGYLCTAWDSWLGDLQGNAKRLLRTDGLMELNDPLRADINAFLATAEELRPQIIVPEAKVENRLGVLAKSPPPEVLTELLTNRVASKVEAASTTVKLLATKFEKWPRWDQLRELQKRLDERRFTQVAGALGPKLPQAPGTEGYKLDPVRTMKLFNDISLDSAGTLPLAGRWSEISRLSADMIATEDRIQKAMPEIILRRLEDKPSISDFADSLVPPLEEMRLHRKQFNEPQVVRDRFLKESALLKETAEVTAEDFPKWEQELVAFTLVAKADDPRLAPELDANKKSMSDEAVELEPEAPASEQGQPATLSNTDFKREVDGLTASLKSLRDRPIVNRDLPDIRAETGKVAGAIQQLYDRVKATLVLLKPETWLAKVALPYGRFTETKQRWLTWRATLDGVTAPMLKADRPRFKQVRADERQIKEWIDGLEGSTGFGALKVPDLAGTASNDTAAELKRLEAVLRDRAVTAVAGAAQWSKALPVTPWDKEKVGGLVRTPLETHSTWLGQLTYFASNLDQLAERLANGFGWREESEGVSEMFLLLKERAGVDNLTGKPAGWYAEAKQLQTLDEAPRTREVLTAAAAAPAGGLSRKLLAWRRLGEVAGWPTGAADFDFDGGVMAAMRTLIGQGVKDSARRTDLLAEMVKGTRLRFNRAARTAARAEAQLNDMFKRMAPANLTEKDLDDPVAYNLALWNLKKYDRNEKNLDHLRGTRDTFVGAVRAINGGEIAKQSEVAGLLTELSALELKDDPNRVPTPSPATVGWQEELTDEGLAMIATWKSGARTARLEYKIVQPEDDTPPFYLARRAIAVGEFLDLMNGRPKEAEVVRAALDIWARQETLAKPWDMPTGWYPRSGSEFKVLELNPRWIILPTSPVQGLLDNTELRATVPQLEQAATEKPTLRSPLQQVTSSAAKIFAEKMLGARLPTVKEWQAVMKVTGATAANGYFRGPNFQKLFNFVRNYHGGGQTVDWQPGKLGSYYPTKKDKDGDEGQPSASTDESRLWFRDVDDGPKLPGGFVNLIGNVSVFLTGEKPDEYYVAGGSVLSPPGIDFTQPQKVGSSSTMIGAKTSSVTYSDVGIRPAFDAPPGFKVRYKLFVLVRDQKYLTL